MRQRTPAPPTRAEIAACFPFPLDDFQVEAMEAVEAGRNVIVCAPTGSGKTAIAEYAIRRALAEGQRCFYTTPLKALSNQKFLDFSRSYGEERVGLLTGDVSVNREAEVVVMTTEVFRNMLYGTILGDVDANLRRVRSVILDECHYMNDAERGTVWEESIIYAPPQVQLVALSATVENSRALRDWMTAVHGPTHLVLSELRPVPLRHYYYHDGALHRLLMPDGGLNPKLRAVGPARPGFRRGLPPRQGKVEPSQVIKALASRRMLPAIYFVFSRRGCEEAMRRVYGQSLLSGAEARQLEQAVDEALADNPRLAEHAHLPYLRQGIAAHHAGLLPAWKALVERLFQQGLIKVVFATETLAAGINMPARTTVIGALVKYSDEGHRMLTASEFLQMSGRAGRRGMDEVGHVVMVHHPREAPEDAARLARSRPDPLLSRFTPRYEMVLNLLQRYPPEQARQLVEKSFGQFLAGGTSEQTAREEAQVRQRIEEIKAPLCPGEPGDLPSYRKLRRHEARIAEQLRSLKGLARGRRAPGLGPAIRALEGRRIEIRQRYGSMPCHGCPVQQPCSRQQQELQRLHHRHSELVRQERRALPPYWQQFQQLASVLRERGYLEGDRPTWRGQLAAALRGTNVLFLAEVASSGILEELTPEQAAAVLNALVTEETRKVQGRLPAPSDEVFRALEQIEVLALEIGRLQRRHGVEVPLLLNPAFAGITERWAQGHAWDDLVDGSGLEEGDVVRALRRTLDMARQWYYAPGTPPLLASMCRRIEALIARDEVLDSLLVE